MRGMFSLFWQYNMIGQRNGSMLELKDNVPYYLESKEGIWIFQQYEGRRDIRQPAPEVSKWTKNFHHFK